MRLLFCSGSGLTYHLWHRDSNKLAPISCRGSDIILGFHFSGCGFSGLGQERGVNSFSCQETGSLLSSARLGHHAANNDACLLAYPARVQRDVDRHTNNGKVTRDLTVLCVCTT